MKPALVVLAIILLFCGRKRLPDAMHRWVAADTESSDTESPVQQPEELRPLVTYSNGVPQPPVVSHSIRTGTARRNAQNAAAYEAALADYNARVAQAPQRDAAEQRRERQISAMQREIARLDSENANR